MRGRVLVAPNTAVGGGVELVTGGGTGNLVARALIGAAVVAACAAVGVGWRKRRAAESRIE
jgi:hypothetical protein